MAKSLGGVGTFMSMCEFRDQEPVCSNTPCGKSHWIQPASYLWRIGEDTSEEILSFGN